VTGRRILLLCVAGLLSASALLAIAILLVGRFGSTEGKILGSTALLAGYGLIALPAVMLAAFLTAPVLMSAFPTTPTAMAKDSTGNLLDSNPVNVPFQNEFKRVFSILKGLGSGKPSDQFQIDLNKKQLINSTAGALSFN